MCKRYVGSAICVTSRKFICFGSNKRHNTASMFIETNNNRFSVVVCQLRKLWYQHFHIEFVKVLQNIMCQISHSNVTTQFHSFNSTFCSATLHQCQSRASLSFLYSFTSRTSKFIATMVLLFLKKSLSICFLSYLVMSTKAYFHKSIFFISICLLP